VNETRKEIAFFKKFHKMGLMPSNLPLNFSSTLPYAFDD